MREPNILANESLVRNGYFYEPLEDDWKIVAKPDWISTEDELYQGELTRFLAAGNEAAVSQDIVVPKKPGANARYVLSFLCEMRHTEAGLLRISGEGLERPFDISLKPGMQRNLEDDQARLASGQPLDFKPIPYEMTLDLPFKRQDTITVSILSPKNEAGDLYSKICITRINLALHLEPAVLQTLTLDAQEHSPSRPLPLCLGADGSLSQSLAIVLESGNAWHDTHAALISDNNPQGAVLVTPDWSVDHPLDSSWIFRCPDIGGQAPYLFTMNLVNQYTAEPYPIAVSLGHHRVAISEVLEAAYYPILGQSVCLGIQVVSYYTSRPLSGRTVSWTVEGQAVKYTAETGVDGWAYFPFEPTVAGMATVMASVESLYYASGVATQDMEVQVLATDPWPEVMSVVEEQVSRWEEKTGYPNRGSTYDVHVKLPSVLSGTELCLRWSGDSAEQLGVAVNPPLGEFIPTDNLKVIWKLASEDRLDGQFYLELVCSRLLLPSPKKRMSLARNLVRIGEVHEANKFPVVDEGESVLLRVQVLHFVVSGDGDPVLNAMVDWVTPEGRVQTLTGKGGWASLWYKPTNAGDLPITAIVRAHEEAVAIEQSFDVHALATSPWKNEVRILLDNEEVDRKTLGVLCRRGQSHTLKIVPLSGSGWIGKKISLHWRGKAPEIGLVPSDLEVPKDLLATGVQWSLDSEVPTSLSSLFELELRLEGVAVARELSGRLVSVDLTEELSLVLDQVRAALDDEALYPCLGALHRFNVLPNALSPLVGLMLSLTWSGTPADDLKATVEPALNVPQSISDGGAIWRLDFTASQQPGRFSLTVALPQLDFQATAKAMVLAHNKVRIGAFRESSVDPIVGQEPAWLWAQVLSHFTGLAVSEALVTWTAESSSEVPAGQDGWSGFALAPKVVGKQPVGASVTSLYDGFVDKRDMEVTALASNPWDGLRVSFDNQPSQPWGSKTYFPRRKGRHSIDLEAASNSPLFGHKLKLGMTGHGPTELGIKFLFGELGEPRPFYDLGLRYEFEVADHKDGSFALRLSSERMASLSPANAMSLGEGSQVLEISDHSGVRQTLDWGQEFFGQITVVSSISGRPMVGWTVTWRSPDLGVKTSVTNYYGVASIRFVPTNPGEAELTATVGDELSRVSTALPYTLNEPREIIELYEPTGSRQPPDELRAYARAKVVSARNGLPLAGVDVWWSYAEQALAPSKTDDDGIASLTFTLSDEEGGVLWAMVKGGITGWDSARLLYAGVVPLIESLTSPNVNIVLGQQASAEVRVVDRANGQPLVGIKVVWTFPGMSLAPTQTGANGISRVSFTPAELGTHPLAATVGFGARSELNFNVHEKVELVEVNQNSLMAKLGESVTANVRVVKQKPEGTPVEWLYPGLAPFTSKADAAGNATYTFTPKALPPGGFAELKATVSPDSGERPSISMNVWVMSMDSEVHSGSTLFINKVPMLFLPHVVLKLTRNKEIAVGLLIGKHIAGKQFSIKSSQEGVSFFPPAGQLVTIDDQFTWTMKIHLPLNSKFTFVITSPSLIGSKGIRVDVVTEATSDELSEDDSLG